MILEPARPDDVFGDDGDLWGSVLRRKGGRFRVLALMPDDPSLNIGRAAFPDQAETLEGEERVDARNGRGARRDQLGEPAGRDHRSLGPELPRMAATILSTWPAKP